ncbi:hypothetical protein J7E49_18795 [Variovorax paradoxus]|nr:hypothetical protein [Variovorax paradoxus]
MLTDLVWGAIKMADASALPAGSSPGEGADRARGIRQVLLCAGLSVSLHAAVLAYHVTPSPLQSSTASRLDGGGSKTVQVRMSTRQLLKSSEKDIATQRGEPMKGRGEISRVSAAPRQAAVIATPYREQNISASVPRSSPPDFSEPIAPASAPDIEPASVASENNSPVDFDGSDYIPRSLLTMPPTALAPIVLGAPEKEFPAGRFVGVLSIFIDEEGRVRHVAEEETTLPLLLAQVAREIFEAARFSPGFLEGRPVRSRLKVEVVFDSTLAERGAGK